MRIVTSGIGLRAGHVLTPLEAELPEADTAADLRGQPDQLPVSILDAMQVGIAAIALDQARTSGQVVDLTGTWVQPDAHGLRQ